LDGNFKILEEIFAEKLEALAAKPAFDATEAANLITAHIIARYSQYFQIVLEILSHHCSHRSVIGGCNGAIEYPIQSGSFTLV
jgi:hypothetical protein